MATAPPDEAMFMAAVGAVYAVGTDQTARSKAQTWIEEFQRTPQAWMVANSVLASVDPGAREKEPLAFMAAMTLHVKIRYDYAELPAEAQTQLRDAVLRHIVRFRPAGASQLSATYKRLCLVLAALAVQMEQWEGVVGSVVSLIYTSPEALLSLLQVLQYLPEEAFNANLIVPSAARRKYQDELIAGSADTIKLLGTFLEPASKSVEATIALFRTIGPWIRYCYVPATTMAASPLLPAVFAAVGELQVFDEAVECIIDLIRSFYSSKLHQAMLGALIPHVMSLAPRWDAAVRDEDEDTCRGLCRIFTELGENQIGLILGPDDCNQHHIVGLVLKCAAHPDSEISSITFRFWGQLAEWFSHMDLDATRDKRKAMLVPMLVQLVPVLVQAAQFPEDYASLSKDRQYMFKAVFRFDASDVLLWVVAVLGIEPVLASIKDVMTRAHAGFVAAMAESSRTGAPIPDAVWRPLEACLFCVRGIAPAVPDEEATLIPAVMDLLPQLPDHPEIRATSFRVLGRYSDYLSARDGLPQKMFEFVCRLGLQVPAADCVAASDTFQYLCRFCAKELGEVPFEAFKTFRLDSMTTKAMLNLYEGLSYSMATLSMDRLKVRLAELMAPLFAKLAELVAASVAAKNVSNAAEVKAQLENMWALMQHALIPKGVSHPAIEFVQQMWPGLQQVVATYIQVPGVMEKMIKFLSEFTKVSRPECGVVLPSMLNLVTETCAMRMHSGFLYFLGNLVDYFMDSPQREHFPHHVDPVVKAVNTVSQQVFTLLLSAPPILAKFTEHPHVVDDFFRLMIFTLKRLPAHGFGSGLLQKALECAMHGINIEHKDAHQSIMVFLEKMMKAARGKHAALAGPVIAAAGPELVKLLMGSIAAGVPRSRIQSSDGAIAPVLYELGSASGETLEGWLRPPFFAIPDTVMSAKDKEEEFGYLMRAVKDAEYETFARVLVYVAEQCWMRSAKGRPV